MSEEQQLALVRVLLSIVDSGGDSLFPSIDYHDVFDLREFIRENEPEPPLPPGWEKNR